MTIIGLTGKSGAGKNTVAEILKRFNIAHMDCDQISRDVSRQGHACYEELSRLFPAALRADGSLSRKEIAGICFRDKDQLHLLNEVTHRYILEEMEHEIARQGANGVQFICVNGATLIESGFAKRCDQMICVQASRAVRLKRVMERDMLTTTEAQARFAAQQPDDYYCKNATYVIENNGNADDLFSAVARIAMEITGGQGSGSAPKERKEHEDGKNKGRSLAGKAVL